jgi:hypothetical protein
MTKQERIALSLSVLTILLGLWMAHAHHDGSYFARSGTILCIIAVIFAYLELRARLARVPAFIDEHLPKYLATVIEAGLARGADRATAEDAARKLESVVRSEVSAEAEKARKRLLRFEAILLVVGTFIWGFGDLLVDSLLRHCTH